MDSYEYDNSFHVLAANHRAGLPRSHGPEQHDDHVELYFDGPAHKLAYQGDEDSVITPSEGEQLVTIYARKHKPGQKRIVVDREDSTLSTQEVHSHWPDVAAAMQKELETWAKLNCFSRKLRKDSRNVIGIRRVHKWKFDQATQSATDSEQSKATVRKIIRSRLCLRGFTDMDKDNVAKYAGTSKRHSQRILCSEAIVRGWGGRG